MTPKYYTPEIEEFHLGFEYEEDDNNSNQWKQEIVTLPGDLDYYDDLIREGNIRVKHLDREDIESLKWKLRTDDNKDIHNPEYTIERWHFKTYPNDFCTIYDDSAVDEYCFRGTVKNKSELKKLMLQLGIN